MHRHVPHLRKAPSVVAESEGLRICKFQLRQQALPHVSWGPSSAFLGHGTVFQGSLLLPTHSSWPLSNHWYKSPLYTRGFELELCGTSTHGLCSLLSSFRWAHLSPLFFPPKVVTPASLSPLLLTQTSATLNLLQRICKVTYEQGSQWCPEQARVDTAITNLLCVVYLNSRPSRH